MTKQWTSQRECAPRQPVRVGGSRRSLRLPPGGRWALSKRPILVAYLNGQDGKWAVLLAPSEEEVRTRFPELEIYSDAPAWMTTLTGPIRERMTVDIDDTDHPFLAAILRGRRQGPSAGP